METLQTSLTSLTSWNKKLKLLQFINYIKMWQWRWVNYIPIAGILGETLIFFGLQWVLTIKCVELWGALLDPLILTSLSGEPSKTPSIFI